MVYCVNNAYLFYGFKILEWCPTDERSQLFLDNDDYKDPWDNEEDLWDVQNLFDRLGGEDSGFHLVVLSRGDEIDVYLASVQCCFKASDWEPTKITRCIDPERLKDVSFDEICGNLGIKCREPSVLLVSDAYYSRIKLP